MKYVLVKQAKDNDKILFRFQDVETLKGPFNIALLTFKQLRVIAVRGNYEHETNRIRYCPPNDTPGDWFYDFTTVEGIINYLEFEDDEAAKLYFEVEE